MYRVMLVEKDRLMLEKLSAVIERTPNFSMAVRYQNKRTHWARVACSTRTSSCSTSMTRMPSP